MKFYELTIDTDYIIDDCKVAFFHSCTQLEDDLATIVWSDQSKNIPGKIYFSVNFQLCEKLSYVCNDINIPIISNKIIDLIDDSYMHLYQFHPVILFDDQYMSPFENGKLKTDVRIREDFSIISFTEKVDVIDYERSHIIERKRILDNSIFKEIKVLIFKHEMNTHPIFKIPFDPIGIFSLVGALHLFPNLLSIRGCAFLKNADHPQLTITMS